MPWTRTRSCCLPQQLRSSEKAQSLLYDDEKPLYPPPPQHRPAERSANPSLPSCSLPQMHRHRALHPPRHARARAPKSLLRKAQVRLRQEGRPCVLPSPPPLSLLGPLVRAAKLTSTRSPVHHRQSCCRPLYRRCHRLRYRQNRPVLHSCGGRAFGDAYAVR